MNNKQTLISDYLIAYSFVFARYGEHTYIRFSKEKREKMWDLLKRIFDELSNFNDGTYVAKELKGYGNDMGVQNLRLKFNIRFGKVLRYE